MAPERTPTWTRLVGDSDRPRSSTAVSGPPILVSATKMYAFDQASYPAIVAMETTAADPVPTPAKDSRSGVRSPRIRQRPLNRLIPNADWGDMR